MEKCDKCGRFLRPDDMEVGKPKHFNCDNCGLFYCKEDNCHCCEGLENER